MLVNSHKISVLNNIQLTDIGIVQDIAHEKLEYRESKSSKQINANQQRHEALEARYDCKAHR